MNALTPRTVDGEILSPNDLVSVFGTTHPLNAVTAARIECKVVAGLSIAEILDIAILEKTGVNPTDLVVHVGGRAIPLEWWTRVRVKKNSVLTFSPRPAGGNPLLRTALTLAIVVAATLAAPYLAPEAITIGAITIAASTAQAVVALGIVTAATLALNALYPVSAAASNPSVTTRNSIQGAQNQAPSIDQAIPVVLGKMRQSPFYAAKPYTEIVGDDQYLRLLFCWGYGPLQIEDLKIGETPLATFSDVQIETRQGFVGDAPITLYPGEVSEQQVSIELKDLVDVTGHNGTGGPWSSLTTEPDTDEISVDFTAPSGIAFTDKDGDDASFSVYIKIQYRPAGSAGAFTDVQTVVIAGRTFATTRVGYQWVVASGQYEVRAQRITGQGNPEFGVDTTLWTALRSIKVAPPIAALKPLALTALRIKATGQLNGTIDTFNGITTSLVNAYSGAGDVWNANTASRSPADLFRHVLQGAANARPVSDDIIDLENLQEWFAFCVANGFKYNEVVTSVGAVNDKIWDIAAAGRAAPTWINGKWGVDWDRPDDPIVQHFTPRNSWGFQLQHPYTQQPHGLRVPFIDETNGYAQDERIVYDDGYDKTNATLFEKFEFTGVTDPALIWKHGRFQIAQARLRPEKVSLSAGWENIVCTRGDRVALTHDAILIGQASGRLKSDPAGQVIVFDEAVIIEVGKTYAFRFRIADDTRSVLRSVDMTGLSPGQYNSLSLVGDLTSLKSGNLWGFGETGLESAIYRVQSIAHQKDLVAQLTLVDDAQAISTADQGPIPAWNPNVSIPADPYTLPPRDFRYIEVIGGQGDTARALVRLSWQVPRLGNVASFTVQARNDDMGGPFVTVDSVLAPRTSTDIPLPAPGTWSFRVQSVFDDNTVSAWVSIISVTLQGLLKPPSAVSNLRDTFISGRSFLSWDQDVDPRTVLVEIRKGASFAAAQIISDSATSPWQTVGDDTYFVTPYVISPFGVRIYATTQSLGLTGTVSVDNIIVSRDERATGWTGTFSGYVGIDQANNFLRTAGNDDFLNRSSFLGTANFLDGDGTVQGGGTYWSADIVDTGGVNFCRISNDWTATGVSESDDFLGNADFLGNLDFLKASLAAFVRVRPVIRISMVGPVPTWGPTQVWSPDVYKGRMFQLGMQFEILDTTQNAIAYLLSWAWSIDVPDRLDSYQDLTVPIGGITITFQPTNAASPIPFNGGLNNEALPHITPSIQQPNPGDLVVWSALSLSSVLIQVKNAGVDVGGSHVNVLVRGY